MNQTTLDIYGSEPIPWSRAVEQLEDISTNKTFWLATTRPDGRLHVAGLGALWDDGKFYFTSGDGTRKSRNLAENPDCVVSVALPNLDLVVEGTGCKATDEAVLPRIKERYAARVWPARV